MAILPRYFSTSDTPAAINSVNMDPGAASQAQAAALQGTQQVMGAAQQLTQQVAQVVTQVEKPDESYLINAKANIEVDYNDKYQNSLSTLKPGGSFDKEAGTLLQSTASPWIEKAPNEATRAKLLQSLVPMSASAIKRAQNKQFEVNSAQKITDLQDYSMKAVSFASLNPQAETQVLDNIDKMGEAMKQQGAQAPVIDKLVKGQKLQVQQAIAMKYAETNPFEALDAVNKGELVHLGNTAMNSVKTRADTKIKGIIGESNKSLDNLNQQISAGQALPEDAITRIDNAISIASKTKDVALLNKATQAAKLAEISKQLTTASYADLKSELAELPVAVARSPNPDLAAAKLRTDLLTNRIKTIEDDPLTYGQIQDKGMELPDLPPAGTDIDKDPNAKNIAFRRNQLANEYSQVLGIPVSPLKKSEVEKIAQDFENMTPTQQEQQLKFLNSFGGDNVGLVADQMTKAMGSKADSKYKALAPTIALMGLEPSLARDILKGQQAMASNQVTFKAKPEELMNATGQTLGGIFGDDPKKTEQFVEAAKALTAAQTVALSRNAKDKDISLTDQIDMFKENLAKVSNVVKFKQSGTGWLSNDSYHTVAPKFGMSADDMHQEIQSLSNDSMLKFGNGVPVLKGYKGETSPFDASTADSYQFVPYRFGKYLLAKGGRKLSTEDGKDYIFDFANYLKSNGK